MCVISVTNINIRNAQIIVTDFKHVSWTLICHWPDIQIAPPPNGYHWLSQRDYIKMNIKKWYRRKKRSQEESKQNISIKILSDMNVDVVVSDEAVWINALFLLRDQICLFPLLSTLFAAKLWRKRGETQERTKAENERWQPERRRWAY